MVYDQDIQIVLKQMTHCKNMIAKLLYIFFPISRLGKAKILCICIPLQQQADTFKKHQVCQKYYVHISVHEFLKVRWHLIKISALVQVTPVLYEAEHRPVPNAGTNPFLSNDC